MVRNRPTLPPVIRASGDRMTTSPSYHDMPMEPVGPIRRKPDIATRIAAEEIKLLIEWGTPNRYWMALGIVIVGVIFSRTSPLWTSGLVLAVQFIAQFYFDQLRRNFRADPDVVGNVPGWARRYMIGAFLSGLTWGVGGIVWLPGSDFAHHIFYALVLASLCMASAVMRAHYLPAVAVFFVAAATPTFMFALLNPTGFDLSGAGLAVFFLLVAFRAAQRLGGAHRDAIRLRFENADLAERMVRAHAATEQKRADSEEAKRQAQGANRAKNEFLDILGHQLGAPLEQLGDMAREIRAEPLNDRQAELADKMQVSASALSRLFNDMVDFSQIEAGASPLNVQRFDPVDLLKDVVREMRPSAVARGLSLELDLVLGALEHMVGDPVRLKQVLTHLVSNAIKFTESGGVILRMQAVTLGDQSKSLRLSVIDTGIGITNDARSRLFDSFVQGRGQSADGANADPATGVGLGLAIADRLVRQMGGQIEVDSAAGQGSTFWFLIPLEMSQAVPLIQTTGHDVERQPRVRAEPRRAGLLVDHDYLYEMEQTLGPEKITDMIVEALSQTLRLLKGIESALADANDEGLREQARKLEALANEIGLLAIAEAAGSLAVAVEPWQIHDISQLQQQISATWDQLANAYPDIPAEPSGGQSRFF